MRDLPLECLILAMKPKEQILMDTVELIKSGYAGVNSQGTIVDRREYPNAIPCLKNTLLGTPEPLPAECPSQDEIKTAYRKGRSAFLTKKDPEKDCPYPTGGALFSRWMDGFELESDLYDQEIRA